jgi:hypothetical protein
LIALFPVVRVPGEANVGPRIEHRYHVIATMVLQLLVRGHMLGGAAASILAIMRLLLADHGSLRPSAFQR